MQRPHQPWRANAIVCGAALILAHPAWATGTSLLERMVIHDHPQTGDHCLIAVPVLSAGIPYSPVLDSIFEDALVWDTTLEDHVNINILASDPPVVSTVTRVDDLTPTIAVDITVDLVDLADAHLVAGISSDTTLAHAKLLVVSLSQTLKTLTDRFELLVDFVGLPPNTPTSGAEIISGRTYTPGSVWLHRYHSEQIDLLGTCP